MIPILQTILSRQRDLASRNISGVDPSRGREDLSAAPGTGGSCGLWANPVQKLRAVDRSQPAWT
jgi:hypothetical protein